MTKLRNTLSDVVRAHIRDGILSGHYSSGQRLSETAIASILSVSRSPIREAIKVLESEGLLVSEAWKGLMIADPNRQETLEIFQYREALEGLAAELACLTITDEELDALEALIEIVDGKIDATRAELIRNNQDFHQLIYAATQNSYLMESVGTVKTLLSLLPGASYDQPNRREDIVNDHRRILEALRQRNPENAKAASQLHVRKSAKMQLRKLVETGVGISAG